MHPEGQRHGPRARSVDVLIASERRRAGLVDVVAGHDDLVIAAIKVAELRTGVELATERHRAACAEYLLRILETLPVEPYDLATAEVHGRLLADDHRGGSTRGPHDLIVAATAVATERTVLTMNRGARFEELPGVDWLVVA